MYFIINYLNNWNITLTEVAEQPELALRALRAVALRKSFYRLPHRPRSSREGLDRLWARHGHAGARGENGMAPLLSPV